MLAAVTHPNDNMQNGTNDFFPEDSGYIYSLLSYHLVSGSWGIHNLGHTDAILQTNLVGRSISYVGPTTPQVIVATADSRGIVIQNQVVETRADFASTRSYENLTIQVVNEVIGFPPAYSFYAAHYDGLSLFQDVVDAAGAVLDNNVGVTVFVPFDQAAGWHDSSLNSTQPIALLSNHVCFFRLLYAPISSNHRAPDSVRSCQGRRTTHQPSQREEYPPIRASITPSRRRKTGDGP